jgi:hypothetical protein
MIALISSITQMTNLTTLTITESKYRSPGFGKIFVEIPLNTLRTINIAYSCSASERLGIGNQYMGFELIEKHLSRREIFPSLERLNLEFRVRGHRIGKRNRELLALEFPNLVEMGVLFFWDEK